MREDCLYSVDAAQLGIRLPRLATCLVIVLQALTICAPSVAQATDQELHDLKIAWSKVRLESSAMRFREAAFRDHTSKMAFKELLGRIDKSRVPVLLPSSLIEQFVKNAENGAPAPTDSQFAFAMTKSGYASVVKRSGLDFLCRGHGVAVLPKGATVDSLATTTDPKVSGNNLGGYVASFRRYGATYACEVICNGGSLDADDMCASQATIQAFINELLPVGPKR